MTLEWCWFVIGTAVFFMACSVPLMNLAYRFLGSSKVSVIPGLVALVAGWKYGWGAVWGPIGIRISETLPQAGTDVHAASVAVILGLAMVFTAAVVAILGFVIGGLLMRGEPEVKIPTSAGRVWR